MGVWQGPARIGGHVKHDKRDPPSPRRISFVGQKNHWIDDDRVDLDHPAPGITGCGDKPRPHETVEGRVLVESKRRRGIDATDLAIAKEGQLTIGGQHTGIQTQ